MKSAPWHEVNVLIRLAPYDLKWKPSNHRDYNPGKWDDQNSYRQRDVWAHNKDDKKTVWCVSNLLELNLIDEVDKFNY